MRNDAGGGGTGRGRSRAVWGAAAAALATGVFAVALLAHTTPAAPAVSVVIDATTGTATDWCQGCAVLPRSG